jgi:hypothetical protein
VTAEERAERRRASWRRYNASAKGRKRSGTYNRSAKGLARYQAYEERHPDRAKKWPPLLVARTRSRLSPERPAGKELIPA